MVQLGLCDGVEVCKWLRGEEGKRIGGGGGGFSKASSSSTFSGNVLCCQGNTSGSLGSSSSVGVGLAIVGLRAGGGDKLHRPPGPGLSDKVTLLGRALFRWLLPVMKFKNLFFSVISLRLCLLAHARSLRSSSISTFS